MEWEISQKTNLRNQEAFRILHKLDATVPRCIAALHLTFQTVVWLISSSEKNH